MEQYYQKVQETLNINTNHILDFIWSDSILIVFFIGILIAITTGGLIASIYYFFVNKWFNEELKKNLFLENCIVNVLTLLFFSYTPLVVLYITDFTELSIIFACLVLVIYIPFFVIILENLNGNILKKQKIFISLYPIFSGVLLISILHLGDRTDKDDAAVEALDLQQLEISSVVVQQTIKESTPINYEMSIENLKLGELMTVNLMIDGKLQTNQNVWILNEKQLASNVLIPIKDLPIKKQLKLLEKQTMAEVPGNKKRMFKQYRLNVEGYPISGIDYFYNVQLQ